MGFQINLIINPERTLHNMANFYVIRYVRDYDHTEPSFLSAIINQHNSDTISSTYQITGEYIHLFSKVSAHLTPNTIYSSCGQ
jgi:hypothetical protein